MNYKTPTAFLAIALASVSMAFMARAASPTNSSNYAPVNMEPPALQREFRAAWIATVENIDWPSKPGLPVKQQQDELLKILDRAAALHLNAVMLQVRPMCDALYASKIEPWSYYLTGTMGKAPEPFYDPLAFAVAEAHKRGLELHAYFNPYRAALLGSKPPPVFSENHISRRHPELVVKYGNLLWLDPGEKQVQDYSLRVVMDVVKRYDIDAVHFDDYFYPYKIYDSQKKEIEFHDDASWKKYGAGGRLTRAEWRRENVNTFVRQVYKNIKATKPWVKFGIAPFGIWQPGFPKQIKGMNAYNDLYCDSRKWLTNGWVDYCSPQLYWAIKPPDQSFPELLKWWLDQNPKHRNIWPGIASANVGGGEWKADEILNQIKITREQCDGATGDVHWSVKALMQDRGGLATTLANGLYAEPALIPSSSWLEQKFPEKPKLKIDLDGNLSWQPAGSEKVSVWVLQTKTDNQWHTRILPGSMRNGSLTNSPDVLSLTEIDRCGVASPSVVLQRKSGAATK